MSQGRLGATCLLVRAMFRNGQVRQAQMQGMRWKGDDHSLPECSLTQAEAFSNLDDLRPGGRQALKTLLRACQVPLRACLQQGLRAAISSARLVVGLRFSLVGQFPEHDAR